MADLGGNAKTREEQIRKMKDATAEIAGTEAGQIFFRELMMSCHFHNSVIAASNSGEVDIHGTLFNEARRRVYLDLRRFIPSEYRKKIEN